MPTEEDRMREIRSIMATNILTVPEDAPIIKAAREMAKNKFSCVVVVRKGKPIGILTERDLISRVLIQELTPSEVLVKDVMTKPVMSIPPESDLIPTGELMKKRRIRRFTVTDEKGMLLGLVTQTDILEGIIKLVKHLDWKLVSMKISVEEYIEKLKETKII
jgi:CBS domain-containing protein